MYIDVLRETIILVSGHDLKEAREQSRHVFAGTDHDYCSLVEERCLDFIHWISAASA